MKDRSPQDSLEVEVADFGPIVEAHVDLRPLTVFVGPSNTGKSYLAILIYALHRHFISDFGHRWMFGEHREIPGNTIDALTGFAKRAAQEITKPQFEGGVVLSDGVTDAISSVFNTQGDQLGNEIVRCFGINELSTLVRRANRDLASVLVRKRLSNDSGTFEHRLSLGARKPECTATFSGGVFIRVSTQDDVVHDIGALINERTGAVHSAYRDREVRVMELLADLTDHALPYVLGPLHLAGFYLPADRTGVMHAHSAVVSAMIGSAAMTPCAPTK